MLEKIMILTPRLFRIMLLAEIPIAVLGGTAEYVFDQVPAGVRTAYDNALSDASVGWMITTGILALVLVACALIVLIGLYQFRPWARKANLLVGGFGLIATVMVGYFVESGAASACYTLASYLWGAVAATSYFSNLSERFEKTFDADASA